MPCWIPHFWFGYSRRILNWIKLWPTKFYIYFFISENWLYQCSLYRKSTVYEINELFSMRALWAYWAQLNYLLPAHGKKGVSRQSLYIFFWQHLKLLIYIGHFWWNHLHFEHKIFHRTYFVSILQKQDFLHEAVGFIHRKYLSQKGISCSYMRNRHIEAVSARMLILN